jgi:hypothetical protein
MFQITYITIGLFHGSVFIAVHARLFLESVSCVLPDIYDVQCRVDYLQESPFLADLDNIVECFDKTTKLRFRNSDEPQYIKFGGARDNDRNCNIRFGQLKLLGSDVARFFEPSVECIINAVLDQCKVAHKPISVGLFSFLRYHFGLNLYSSISFSSVASLLVTGYSTMSGKSSCSMTSMSLGLKIMCPCLHPSK